MSAAEWVMVACAFYVAVSGYLIDFLFDHRNDS